ncbi:hypothetical protein NDN08_005089 [Rhodosorus marinus]|uniref:Palmitoyltransferase n=1 Tax=Rhodosorus marinus TaxID=101924 RepID=A0AAV8V1K2_9RHOD|nr:hypothetical protein NDN08_005089 [Rhodosorus marinus]
MPSRMGPLLLFCVLGFLTVAAVFVRSRLRRASWVPSSLENFCVNTIPRLLGSTFFAIAALYIYGSSAFFVAVVQPALLRSQQSSTFLEFWTKWITASLSWILLVSLLFNFVMVVAVDPGNGSIENEATNFCETCTKGRSERAHHCSTCDRCIERLEHHCVWLNTCVGQQNYRYFWLFLWYLWTFLAFVVWTVSGPYADVEQSVPITNATNCSEVLGGVEAGSGFQVVPETCRVVKLSSTLRVGVEFLFITGVATVTGVFLLWLIHLYLALTNQTTIELVENVISQRNMMHLLMGRNPNSKGWQANFREMLAVDSNESILAVFMPKLPRSSS